MKMANRDELPYKELPPVLTISCECPKTKQTKKPKFMRGENCVCTIFPVSKTRGWKKYLLAKYPDVYIHGTKK